MNNRRRDILLDCTKGPAIMRAGLQENGRSAHRKYLRRYRHEQHRPHRSHHRVDPASSGFAPDLAVQRRLGLLSERWPGAGAAGDHRSAFAGETVVAEDRRVAGALKAVVIDVKTFEASHIKGLPEF